MILACGFKGPSLKKKKKKEAKKKTKQKTPLQNFNFN